MSQRKVEDIFVFDSITEIAPRHAGCVVVAGSHGGIYPAYLAATAHVCGVIFNDAGIGCDEAGVAGLAYLDAVGLAAATVHHGSARIGNGNDMMKRGVISRSNGLAARLGCFKEQKCADAARIMLEGLPPSREAPPYQEARLLLKDRPIPVWGLDSVSLVQSSDRGTIIISGSHGGILGNRQATAIKVDALAAVYHDAGIGIDNAGLSRLPALDLRGIAGATVAADSARIGDARSIWATGRLSAVNSIGMSWGAEPGMSVPAFAEFVARRASLHST